MKKALRAGIFMLVLICSFYFVNAIMKFKYEDGIETMNHFYDLPEGTVDVLLAGSSHIGMNVDPSILWDEYGIAGYTLWGGFQPAWNSYYFIKEAFQYQTPRLVVLDIYLLATDLEYSEYSGMVKNTIGMRMSRDRVNATRVSTRPDQFVDVLLGWPNYHARYAELTRQDFDYFFWNKHTDIVSLEYGVDDAQPMAEIETGHITSRAALFPKQEEYLMKIIELCKEYNTPLLLISSPFLISENEQERFNTVADIAAQNGVAYLNYNEGAYRDAGISTQEDFRDEGHLNMVGIAKYTKHLGGFIKERYDIPDRRVDAGHVWNADATERVDASLVYVLPEVFTGDGSSKYIDTGFGLYELPTQSWTLKTEIDTRALGGQVVYLSCFSEDSDDMRGLLIRKVDDSIQIIVGKQKEYSVEAYGDTLYLSVVRDGDVYAIYADGEPIAVGAESAANQYGGHLLIGAQEDTEGGIFRHGPVTIYSLEVYSRALSEREIKTTPERAAMSAQQASLPSTDGEAASSLLYRMPERFEGDPRIPSIDTGIKLFDDPGKSWSLLCEISPEVDSVDGVYLSCFNETDGHYGGLLVRRDGDSLSIIHGPNWNTTVDIPPEGSSTLAVVKNGNAYILYVNGEQVEVSSVETEAYDGNLIVGAQQMPDGSIFRTSGTTVYALEVYSGALTEDAIRAWQPVLPPPPVYPQTDIPAYTLEKPFLGDGASRYVDTGVRLYDDPTKDWSIDMTFAILDEGVYASCFNEAGGDYYGLLVRQTDAQTLTVITGKHYTYIPIQPLTRSMHLAITKENAAYSIYVDGALYAKDIVSECSLYNGNLLLACQDDANGNKFRFSAAQIDRFNLVDAVLTQEEVLARSQETKDTLRGW